MNRILALFILLISIKCHIDTAERNTDNCREYICIARGPIGIVWTKVYGEKYTRMPLRNPNRIDSEAMAEFNFELYLRLNLEVEFESLRCTCR